VHVWSFWDLWASCLVLLVTQRAWKNADPRGAPPRWATCLFCAVSTVKHTRDPPRMSSLSALAPKRAPTTIYPMEPGSSGQLWRGTVGLSGPFVEPQNRAQRRTPSLPVTLRRPPRGEAASRAAVAGSFLGFTVVLRVELKGGTQIFSRIWVGFHVPEESIGWDFFRITH
jgi:hypothetical protein